MCVETSVEEQAAILIKKFPELKNTNLRALSVSGILWVNEQTGETYKVWDKTASKVVNNRTTNNGSN